MKLVMKLKYILSILWILSLAACGGGGGGGGDDGSANRPPVASFSLSATNGTAPLAVTFDAGASSDSDGTIASYTWSFGDGQSGVGINPSHTYVSAGVFTVTLTVTDDDGEINSITATVTVTSSANQSPNASVSATPTSGAAPLAVTFDGSASSDTDGTITLYRWDFGDGQNSLGSSASHTYTTAGTYTATLTVTDNSGATDAASTVISVTSSGTTTYTLSGTITSSENINVDSDLNDPLAAYADNSDFAQAQEVANPLMINGFVSDAGTGVAGDRFESSEDSSDFFHTSLYQGQFVSLRVASFDTSDVYANDVDIRLYDASLTLISESNSVTEFESVEVPADGEYYIQVLAYSGVNKYILSIGSTTLDGTNTASGWKGEFLTNQAIVRMSPPDLVSGSVESLSRLDDVTLSHDGYDRAALLRLTPETTVADAMVSMNVTARSEEQEGWMRALSDETRSKIETLRLIKQLNRREDVVSASPNFIVKAMQEPNDTFYSFQEHYRQIRLPQAWDLTTGAPASGQVIVAVIDSGLAMDHEDFDGQKVTGYDFVSDASTSNDGDGIDADPNDPGSSTTPGESVFHGTHVSGTIAAASNNGLGVAGIAWDAKIMPLRALFLGGNGSYYDIYQAIRYAAGMSNDSNTVPVQAADIINMSLGGEGASQEMQDLITEVRNRGVIVIAASGNNNSSTLFYPASYDGVISVSAMDWDNNKAPYSNYGSAIDIGAPGGNVAVDNNGDSYGDGVLSCVINDSSGQRQSNYRYLQGTSMASPHVAGVVALMKAVYPGLTPAELDTLLASGAMTNDLGAPGRDDIFGYGMLDALKAVQAAQNAAGNPLPGNVIASPTSFDFGSSLQTTTITLSGQGNAPPGVTSVSSSAAWLTVSAGTVDGNGIGDYQLTVDRTGLVDAVYTGDVDFDLSDGTRLSVSVSMRVRSQPADTSGNAGFLYLVLFDLDMVNSGQLNLSPVDGVYDFLLTDVAAGDYYLVAGSDVDNDGFICEVGESCATYPVQGQEAVVTVDRDLSGLDFLATINSGLGSASITSLALPAEGIAIKPVTGNNKKGMTR